MSWDEQRAKDRVAQHDFSTEEINVSDLSRTMDFDNLGTKDVRRANGVHVYADISNFHDAVNSAGADKQKQRKLLRAASVLRRVQADLLTASDIGPIQLQAARLHCLNFKPYDDEIERAKQAVILSITLNSYLYEVFNVIFQEVQDFEGSVGIDAGVSYIANIGFHGDRELICLGTCANVAAKILNGNDAISITAPVYTVLPGCLQSHFQSSGSIAGTRIFRAVGLNWNQYPDLAEELAIEFDEEQLTEKTETLRDALPLDEMNITDAIQLIDLDLLTERNNKRVSAAAIFADLDGFTRYVQAAEADDDVISLIRTLHMIRYEFHAVIKQDYPGLVIQHQGDRVIAIVHLPSGDAITDRCCNALEIAIGLQSSMEHVLNKRLENQPDLHVAIGLDIGLTLITRLGKKGRREVIFLGPQVMSAEQFQLHSSGQQIRISQTVFEAIKSEIVKEMFKKDNDGTYVAKSVTFPRIDELEEEAAARAGTIGAATHGHRVEVITTSDKRSRPWGNAKPWSSS